MHSEIYSDKARWFSLNASVACAGAIPSALAGLSALETLDLSHNQLSGESVRGFCVFVLACPYVFRNNRVFTKAANGDVLYIGRGKKSCIMVCLAVRSAFEFQGCNFVHEDGTALDPNVFMLIVVVIMNGIGHG